MPFAYIVLRGDAEERINGEEHNYEGLMGIEADILKVGIYRLKFCVALK